MEEPKGFDFRCCTARAAIGVMAKMPHAAFEAKNALTTTWTHTGNRRGRDTPRDDIVAGSGQSELTQDS
jgi:hypothetical protein